VCVHVCVCMHAVYASTSDIFHVTPSPPTPSSSFPKSAVNSEFHGSTTSAFNLSSSFRYSKFMQGLQDFVNESRHSATSCLPPYTSHPTHHTLYTTKTAASSCCIYSRVAASTLELLHLGCRCEDTYIHVLRHPRGMHLELMPLGCRNTFMYL